MALNWHTAGVVIYVALVVINHVGHVQSVGDDDKIKCVSKCFSIPIYSVLSVSRSTTQRTVELITTGRPPSNGQLSVNSYEDVSQ